MMSSRNLETVLHSKKVVYLDATMNPLLVSCVKKFGDAEGNSCREIIGVILGGSNYIIGMLLHHIPEGNDLSNEEIFGALTLLITEQAYQLFQGNRKINVCTFPNQETVIEVITPDIMIPSYHNAYFLSDLLQPRVELVNAKNAAKIANGCKRVLIIMENATSDSIETLEHSAVPVYMTDQFKNSVQSAARAVQHFDNGYFPITMRLNFMDNVDAGQLHRDRMMQTSNYSMPCSEKIVQRIGGMAPMGLQETDKCDLKNTEKNAALEKEEGITENTTAKKKLTVELTEDNNEKPAFKFDVMNQSELVKTTDKFNTTDKLEWLLCEQHRMANPGKKLEPLVVTINIANVKRENLMPENKTNISPTFDDRKSESSEKSELLIKVRSLNKLLEDPEQAKAENSKSGKTDKQKRRVQRLVRERAMLDRAENLLDTMEKGLIYIPEIKDQESSLLDNSSAQKTKCLIFGVFGLLTSYFLQIVFLLPL